MMSRSKKINETNPRISIPIKDGQELEMTEQKNDLFAINFTETKPFIASTVKKNRRFCSKPLRLYKTRQLALVTGVIEPW